MSTNLKELVTVPYEDLVCAECGYGAVDSEGLCVMDVNHIAVSWTTELPQRDGYYFYRTLVRAEMIERFDGLFYTEHSRFAYSPEQEARGSGEYLGPIQSRHFEELLQVRRSLRPKAAVRQH